MDEELLALARRAVAGDPRALYRFDAGVLRLHGSKPPNDVPRDWSSPAMRFYLRNSMEIPGSIKSNDECVAKWRPLMEGLDAGKHHCAATLEFEAKLLGGMEGGVRELAFKTFHKHELEWFSSIIPEAAEAAPDELLRFYFPVIRRRFTPPKK